VRSAIYRCITPHKSVVSFSDVVFADILTSYAKVFGDLWLFLWMLLPGGSLLVLPPQGGWSRDSLSFIDIDEVRAFWSCSLLVLIICSSNSIPHPIHFRQCLTNTGHHLTGAGGLCTTLSNTLHRSPSSTSPQLNVLSSRTLWPRGSQVRDEPWHGEHQLFRLWCVSRSPTR
jgi:hypothetical protein